MTQLRCLDQHQGGCRGAVEQRTLDGFRYWPRCERHFERRIARYEGSLEQFAQSVSPPSWFDPAAAGESWDEP